VFGRKVPSVSENKWIERLETNRVAIKHEGGE
jgi:hypothetical protein